MNAILLIAAVALLSPENGAVVPVDRPLRISWSGETNAVYLVSVSCPGSDPQLFSVSNRLSALAVNLELGKRYDWSVRQAGDGVSASARFETAAVPPRLLYAEGVRNLRDFGGGRTLDGKRVRQNMIFRSASPRLTGVTAAGIATLRDEFSIRTELDLRPSHDILSARGTVLGPGVRWKNVPFESGSKVDGIVGGREGFVRLFAYLSDKDNLPALVVDEDGGARTATLAFLINGLLGVTGKDLRRDWNVSDDSLRELLRFLNTLPGATMRERIASYVRGCGIADSEIEVFRSLMLEAE